ncbi:MAG: shikimate dehydrogenase, partial [Alistipes sp.]|nr:shikimate dehydrogenase [Alistipes sp.]
MRRYGLIGFPLGHSRSAAYFTEKFARERIEGCRYDLFELDTIEKLPGLLERMPELCGFNVTIPYKRQILPFLDDLSEEARRIGAVNCVRRTSGGQLVGYNTDAAGLSSSLERFLAGTAPERALVLSTGGAS